MASNFTGFENFAPGSVGEFVDGLVSAIVSVATDWWNRFKDDAEGILRSMAEGILQTKASFAAGRIDAARAKSLARIHQLAFRNFALAAELTPFILAQKIVNVVTSGASWAFFNLTGLNIAPGIVKPA